MKGLSVGIFLIMLFLIGGYQLYFTGLVGLSGVRVGSKHYQEDIYALQNSIDMAKDYLNVSLEYSYYQACYDNLAHAGWSPESIPDDYTNSINGEDYVFLAPKDKFKDNLEATTLKHLNTYASKDYTMMDSYSVDMPSYTSMEINEGDGKAIAGADSDGMLSITRYVEEDRVGESYLNLKEMADKDKVTEKITITGSPTLSAESSDACFHVYGLALDKASTLEAKVLQALEDAISELESGIQTPDSCGEALLRKEQEIMETEFGDGADLIKVVLNMQVVFFESESGRYNCRFRELGDSFAVFTTYVEDDEERSFPVWNGEKVAMEPLSMSFSYNVTKRPG